MRGKPVCVQAFAVRTRIIPAHAGQTMPKMLSIDLCTDHPRACGANAQRDERAATVAGSSPRMRGKRWSRRPRCHSPRIIPAHAGQTTPPDWKHWYRTDHPRACGANHRSPRRHPYSFGSSPRMRGKRCHILHGGWYMRIIPAHAGQTRSWRRRSQATSDHPRACGANSMTCATCFHGCGSSPRMRGKLANRMLCVPVCRIIPAHAGQTCEASSCSPVTADHPRACGANDL